MRRSSSSPSRPAHDRDGLVADLQARVDDDAAGSSAEPNPTTLRIGTATGRIIWARSARTPQKRRVEGNEKRHGSVERIAGDARGRSQSSFRQPSHSSTTLRPGSAAFGP